MMSLLPTDTAFANQLRYGVQLDDEVCSLEPHDGFLRGYRFRGKGILGQTWYDIGDQADKFAQGLMQLDSSYCIHVTTTHRPGGQYPSGGCWPDRMVRLLDFVRRSRYDVGGDHDDSEGSLWIAQNPKTSSRSRFDWLTGRAKNEAAGSLEAFRQRTDAYYSSIRSVFAESSSLSLKPEVSQRYFRPVSDEILSLLAGDVLGLHGRILSDASIPVWMSDVLSPSSVELGEVLRIGQKYLNVFVFRSFPAFVSPGFSRSLDFLGGAYRFTARLIPTNAPEAEAHLSRMTGAHAVGALSLSSLMKRSQSSADLAQTSLGWQKQAKEMTDALDAGVRYAHSTLFLITYSDSEEQALAVAHSVEESLAAMRMGMGYLRERNDTAMHAYLASLPGEALAYPVRRAFLPVAAAARIAPLWGSWHGPKEHPDRRIEFPHNGPVLTTTTKDNEIFRLFLHVGQVGHTIMVARTGRGKSFFYRALENGFLSRYSPSRVLNFDIGYSSFKYAHAIGGQHYAANLYSGPLVAPLTGIHLADEYAGIEDWLIEFVEVWLERTLDSSLRSELARGLSHVRDMYGEEKPRLSDVLLFCQSTELRDFGSKITDTFLDAPSDGFSFSSARVPYWSFEIGDLGIDNPRWVSPYIAYVQRRAFAEFSRTSASTLVTVDEFARAQRVRNVTAFSERLEREGRKNKVTFVAATQGVDEILNSPMGDVLIEQSVSRIAGSNSAARSEKIADKYRKIGFSDDAVSAIATGMDEFDWLIENDYGTQIFSLRPTDFELALMAGASSEDREKVQSHINTHGARWVPSYLRDIGVDFLESYAQTVEAWDSPLHLPSLERQVV